MIDFQEFVSKLAATFMVDGECLRATLSYGQWTSTCLVSDRIDFTQAHIGAAVAICREGLAKQLLSAADLLGSIEKHGLEFTDDPFEDLPF